MDNNELRLQKLRFDEVFWSRNFEYSTIFDIPYPDLHTIIILDPDKVFGGKIKKAEFSEPPNILTLFFKIDDLLLDVRSVKHIYIEFIAYHFDNNIQPDGTYEIHVHC